LFSPSRKQHNNKESLATDLFKRLNFEQSFFKTVFLRNSLKNFLKMTYAKSRGEELETETEILRDRDRDRDFKKRVSRRVSRPRPSLETPSLAK